MAFESVDSAAAGFQNHINVYNKWYPVVKSESESEEGGGEREREGRKEISQKRRRNIM